MLKSAFIHAHKASFVCPETILNKCVRFQIKNSVQEMNPHHRLSITFDCNHAMLEQALYASLY